MVDILNSMGYYWNIVTEDKTMDDSSAHKSMLLSLQQVIDYLHYQREYQGKYIMSIDEIVDQLNQVMAKYSDSK